MTSVSACNDFSGKNSKDPSFQPDVATPKNPEPAETPHDLHPATELATVADPYSETREEMVLHQLAFRDISDRNVLRAMQKVARHKFVPAFLEHRAYEDTPLPIGHQQTISQPYIVALMTQLAEPAPHKKALDIGTGSGYQAAVLAELVASVHSIEIVEPLALESKARLDSMGYKNITVRHGDGYDGWASQAPFDIIIVAAAPPEVPRPLIEQLAPTGKMVIPVGERSQHLRLITKAPDGSVRQQEIAPVAFVPMTGKVREQE